VSDAQENFVHSVTSACLWSSGTTRARLQVTSFSVYIRSARLSALMLLHGYLIGYLTAHQAYTDLLLHVAVFTRRVLGDLIHLCWTSKMGLLNKKLSYCFETARWQRRYTVLVCSESGDSKTGHCASRWRLCHLNALILVSLVGDFSWLASVISVPFNASTRLGDRKTCNNLLRLFLDVLFGHLVQPGVTPQKIASWIKSETRTWADAQRDGRPAECRWCPLFNAAKFGWRPLLHGVQ